MQPSILRHGLRIPKHILRILTHSLRILMHTLRILSMTQLRITRHSLGFRGTPLKTLKHNPGS